MRKLLKNAKGLTLVELLAVIVILGVISAIAVPSIGGIIASSKVKADVQTKLLIQDAALKWAIDTEPTAAALTALSNNVAISTLVGGYLAGSTPKSAQHGTEYTTVEVTLTTSGYTVGDVEGGEAP